SVHADEGPTEVQRITRFLRQIVVSTGATVLINHNDVKPPSNAKDERRRGHRASGGDWFAASECPIAFEPAGESCSLVYPESYKLSTDPAPFSFRIETDDPQRPVRASLIGEDTTVQRAPDFAAEKKILAYLAQDPGASGSRVATGCQMNKDTALMTLGRLKRAGKIDSVEAEKRGKATKWFIKTT